MEYRDGSRVESQSMLATCRQWAEQHANERREYYRLEQQFGAELDKSDLQTIGASLGWCDFLFARFRRGDLFCRWQALKLLERIASEAHVVSMRVQVTEPTKQPDERTATTTVNDSECEK